MGQDLLGQTPRIHEKATESEVVVPNIMRDIQVLDTARKKSMTVLRRLQMLGVFVASYVVMCGRLRAFL
jgi:hypothetical protein